MTVLATGATRAACGRSGETPRERRRGKLSKPFAAERSADKSDTKENEQKNTENVRRKKACRSIAMKKTGKMK